MVEEKKKKTREGEKMMRGESFLVVLGLLHLRILKPVRMMVIEREERNTERKTERRKKANGCEKRARNREKGEEKKTHLSFIWGTSN